MKNLGHRLGGDYTGEKPNSFESLRASWKDQKDKDFHYHELDICETKDRQLCVVHDRDLMSGDKVRTLTMREIRLQEPWRMELADFFQKVKRLDLDTHNGLYLCKPIMVELKRLHTDSGRDRLVSLIHTARRDNFSKVEIHAICFKGGFLKINHFEDCFPKKDLDKWKQVFAGREINVLNIYNKKKDCFKNEIFKTVKPDVPTNAVVKKKKGVLSRILDWFKRLF